MNLLKTLLKNKIRIGILLFVLACIIGLFFGFFNKTKTIFKPTAMGVRVQTPLLKSHLRIPQIQVDSIIESVGLNKDGSMGAPIGPDGAGLYDKGPIPGVIGSAVIDGHSGWKDGIKAIFDDLHQLKKGDKIYVDNDTGLTTTFMVTDIKVYKWTDDTHDVFLSNDNKAHLNLITCTGDWDNVLQGKLERLVVFSVKI